MIKSYPSTLGSWNRCDHSVLPSFWCSCRYHTSGSSSSAMAAESHLTIQTTMYLGSPVLPLVFLLYYVPVCTLLGVGLCLFASATSHDGPDWQVVTHNEGPHQAIPVCFTHSGAHTGLVTLYTIFWPRPSLALQGPYCKACSTVCKNTTWTPT